MEVVVELSAVIDRWPSLLLALVLVPPTDTELDVLMPVPLSRLVELSVETDITLVDEAPDAVVEVGVVLNTETLTSATGAETVGGGGGV